MSRMMWMATVVACAASVGAAARDPGTITVTGCVQNFSSTGATGMTERGYLLSNTTLVKSPTEGAPIPFPTQGTTAAGTPTGTSGTAAAGMPTSATWPATTGTMITRTSRAKSSYRLDGSDGDLKAHVGHKVEVTGTIEPRSDRAAKSDAERLHVASVRMISSGCSR